MRAVLYMAWRYLAYHRVKTAILVASIALIVYIPVGLRVLVSQSEEQLTLRAASTPLVIGAKGSPLELVLNTLYFKSEVPDSLPYGQAERVDESGLALAIPVLARFRSRKAPVVGTTLDYFDFRGLRIGSGRAMALLGECIVGSQVAADRGLEPGDHVVSSPESVFDIAGVYPLKMRVAGVLAPSDSPDDHAIFVDVKTAWVIEGLAHGHQDLSRPEASPQVLRREGNVVVGNASVVQYTEITEDNVNSFHFHGDPSEFPITAIIAVPHDGKSGTLLAGRYLSQDEPCQIVAPADVMDELLATVLTVQTFVVAAVIVVGLSTLASILLVFMLSLRLRRGEIETMHKIGGSRLYVTSVLSAEAVVVLAISLTLAGGLTLLTRQFGAEIIRAVIL